jgi:uncharacterized protein
MRLAFTAAPDDSAVRAVTYGPVVLSGRYGASYAVAGAGAAASGSVGSASAADLGSGDALVVPLPVLDTASVRRTAAQPMSFAATADGQRITMIPVARVQHEHYTVYWRTA